MSLFWSLTSHLNILESLENDLQSTEQQNNNHENLSQHMWRIHAWFASWYPLYTGFQITNMFVKKNSVKNGIVVSLLLMGETIFYAVFILK